MLGQLLPHSTRGTDPIEMLETAVLLSSTKPWNHAQILTSVAINLVWYTLH